MNHLKKQHNPSALLLFSLLWAVSGFTPGAYGAELHFLTGGFSVSASSENRSGNITNLGAYHAAYERRIISGLEFSAGYTVLVSGFLSGDLAYGLDLGLNYYPFSESEMVEFRDRSHVIRTNPLWRPYFGSYFVQRQFQSIQTGYAGVGFALGTERALVGSYSLKLMVRHVFYAGSRTSSAQETTFFAGLSFAY